MPLVSENRTEHDKEVVKVQRLYEIQMLYIRVSLLFRASLASNELENGRSLNSKKDTI